MVVFQNSLKICPDIEFYTTFQGFKFQIIH